MKVWDGVGEVVLSDVMLGEVWLCSGQSNMEWSPANGLTDCEREVAAADCPDLRIFYQPKRASRSPQDDCYGRWDVCTPEVMRGAVRWPTSLPVICRTRCRCLSES